ncbi:MAG: 2-oxoacid:acceptor oxidoreductase subunit alpha [Elusimicrobia bacterium]|nr:2-oxoacid:acceptor oxidoreductase subunit alpha [Elusimicrobiota bacterium]
MESKVGSQALRKATVWIGGAAGDGIASVAETLAKACARAGLYAYAYNSYQSLIRGGHVYMQIRIGHKKVWSQGDYSDFLIALNLDTVQRHAKDISAGGAIIYNKEKIKVDPTLLKPGVVDCGIPSTTIANQFGKSPIMQNTVALGALSYLMNFPFESISEVLTSTFKRKGDAVVNANVGAARAGYDFAKSQFKPSSLTWQLSHKSRMFLTGNQAVALGAVAAGCKFYSAYPMTPASGILHWLAPHGSKYGVVVKQCEDEIAAMNMAVGAGHVGTRAMTGTSGGGFALMTEAVGLAAMIEAPVVVVNCQRGGPSTGLPTKTEQADLFQALGASQGEYPKFVIAPANVEEAFYLTMEAFNLAEKYQCPVILLSDLLLAEHFETIDDLDFSKVKIDRGEMVTQSGDGGYKRYLCTPSGISPRAVPGTPGTIYVAGSDEHEEDGTLISDVFTDPVKRVAMMDKRMRKMQTALQNLPAPQLVGPENAELTVVGWGSTYSAVRDVARMLEKEGVQIAHLHIRYVWPFQSQAVSKILKSSKKTLIIENNFTGQMEKLIRQETGLTIQHHLRKYDGEPFGPIQVYQKIKEVLSAKKVPELVA